MFTGSGSLLLQPSELIESRNEAEAMSRMQTVEGHGVQAPLDVFEKPVCDFRRVWMRCWKAGLGCDMRSSREAAAGDADVQALVSLGSCRRGAALDSRLLLLSCQAGAGRCVWRRARRGCGHSNGRPWRLSIAVRRWVWAGARTERRISCR